MTATLPNLKSLLLYSRDGEWGKAEPEAEDDVEMYVIRGTDFENVLVGDLTDVPVRFIPSRIAERKTLQPNDILLETAGGSKNRPTGRSVFLKHELFQRTQLPITCASFSRFLRIDETQADPRYMRFHLQYLYETGHLLKYHTQHTGVARFQYTTFSEQEGLDLPPLETQRQIADILSAYDDLIENNTRRIQILEELARTIYREWFVHFRYPGHASAPLVDSPIGPVPEGWEVVGFADLAEFVNGFAFKPAHHFDTGKPIIKIKELKNGVTDQTPRNDGSEIKEKYHITNGDILFSWSADLDAYLWTGGDALLNQHLFVVRPGELVTRDYIFHALKEKMFEFQSRSQGTTMRHIKRSALTEVKVATPPLQVQHTFSDHVGPIHDLLENLTTRNGALSTARDLLLPRLITGEFTSTDQFKSFAPSEPSDRMNDR